MPDDHQDRAILISALQIVLPKWQRHISKKSLLGSHPPPGEQLQILEAAIADCKAFQAVKGRSLFSGYSGVVIQPSTFSALLLYHIDLGVPNGRTPEDAANWLIGTLKTRTASGNFVAVLWGLSVEQDTALGERESLLPFGRLVDSPMKNRITQKIMTLGDYVWFSESYFDKPASVLIRRIDEFPYIGNQVEQFDWIDELQILVQSRVQFLQASATVQPLVAATWFEYEDRSLDINAFENYIGWIHPEIAPRVKSHVSVDASALQRDSGALWALQQDWRTTLERSMERFALSQSRRKIMDRVLDLAIAFEIALTGGTGDNAPASWKVGVRSAQMIGGNLNRRKRNRSILASLYALRNKGSHGGSLKETDQDQNEVILKEASSLYRKLIKSFLSHGVTPDWPSLELEPRKRGD